MAKSKKKTASKKKEEKVVQKAVFLDESYFRTVKVDDLKGYPKFTFKYRPMNLYEESQLADDVLGTATILEAAEYNVAMIAKHIISWDLKHLNLELDHSDIEIVAKIASPIIHRICGEIRGDSRVTEDDVMMLRAQVKN